MTDEEPAKGPVPDGPVHRGALWGAVVWTLGVAALLVSSGGFVLLHATGGSLSIADAVQLLAVGGMGGLLVLLTGRIWGAVLTHVVYNASYLALVAAGTLLS